MKTMLFGPIDRMQEIPVPKSGMDWSTEHDAEVTELLSGGRHVYRAPTGFKTYSMSWNAGTDGLQPLIDLHNGVYGQGPFYVLDPNFTKGNVLPARWASPYLLRHSVRGWANPQLVDSAQALSGQGVKFTNLGDYESLGESLIIPTVPKKPFYLTVWGSYTGEAMVQVYLKNRATGEWTNTADVLTGTGELEVINPIDAANGVYSAVKLELVCPAGSTLTLDHINLMIEPGIVEMQGGRGVGAVQFTGSNSGSITSRTIDRIGLALDVIEVE